ncbi:hypothetical protein ACFSQU_18155 [Massilia sp. GCM10020059]|uniref:DUF1983 domain-containing protein n=1 Tax=Massilia agrisoli TaxID=2892444 RepID=A0ABS8ISR0_9BURK|nr:hypothetical protein [Massilia agrisoli]MCC6071466.1 hypothetical protein [Massilia agrisoli]
MAITPVPTMTDTPPFPALADRAEGTYNAKAYAFGSHMSEKFNGELVAVAESALSNAIQAATSAASAAEERALAETAAANAVVVASTAATSTTSLGVGTGSKSLTLAQTGKTFSVGQQVVIASTADPRDWMSGTLTAFTAGTGAMTVFVTSTGSATAGVFPTRAAWTVALTTIHSGTGIINELEFDPVVSAATVNLDGVNGNFGHMTGSVAVTAFTLGQGRRRRIVIDGAPIITNNANIIVQGGKNYQAAPGDALDVVGEGGGVVRVSILRTSGRALGGSVEELMTVTVGTPVANIDFLSLFSSGFDKYTIDFQGIKTSVDSFVSLRAAVAGAADATTGSYTTALGGSVTTGTGNSVPVSPGNVLATGRGMSGTVTIDNVNDATTLSKIDVRTVCQNTATPGWLGRDEMYGYIAASIVSGFRILANTGNIVAGTIRVFGHYNA